MSSPRDVLRARAHSTPDHRAYVFLDDDGAETATLSYGELLTRARAVAVAVSTHARPGDRALLLFAPGLDFLIAFFACLERGVIAVPVVPPRQGRVQDVTRRIIDDADPAVVLTDRPTVSDAGASVATDRPWLVIGTDDEPAGEEIDDDLFDQRPADSSAPAFLQYTSGSTSAPKGVIVTHGNLAADEDMMARAFGHDEHSTLVGWTPLFHDQGLICNALQPLHLGTPAILMAPRTFIRRPLIWPETITRYRASTSGGPDFAFAACIAAAEHLGLPDGLDLSCWTVAYDGAEPIRASTMRRFVEVFAPAGLAPEALYPCYGLAEGTLMVTGSRLGRGPRFLDVDADVLGLGRLVPAPSGARVRTLVGSGEATPDSEVRIIDPDTGQRCGPGEIGEIQVAGAHVTAGYWRRPEATTATFPIDTDGQRWLRTGDLGALLERELFVVGRRSDVIIVRGRNHHPSDIEAIVTRAHPAVGVAGPATVAAFGLPDAEGGGERVVVVAELRPNNEPTTEASIETAIRSAVLREHDIALAGVVLTRRGALPRTSSGKVQRRSARAIYLEGGFPAAAAVRERANAS